MIFRIFIVSIFILSITNVIAQQPEDSTTVNNLNEVMVTGQYNKQSVDKSVFEVMVISRKNG